MPLRNRFSALHEWKTAAFLCISALGPGVVSGREMTFFYAQTGSASHLGVLLCGALYGIFAGLTACYARRTGAESFPQIFRRSLGVYAGGTVWVLHALALSVMGYLMLRYAGTAMEKLLPLQHAALIGMGGCVLLAAVLAFKKRQAAIAGFLFIFVMLVYLSALCLWGRLPAQAQMYYHTKLRFKDSAGAAMALAVLHGCRCMAVTGGTAALFAREVRPMRLGVSCGICMFVMLEMANAVLRSKPVSLLALAEPFIAMCAEWGKAGYYFAGTALWTAAVLALAGVMMSFRGILRANVGNGC